MTDEELRAKIAQHERLKLVVEISILLPTLTYMLLKWFS